MGKLPKTIPLETDLVDSNPAVPRSTSRDISSLSELDLKQDLRWLSRNRVYNEYINFKDKSYTASRPVSAVKTGSSDGRLSLSICVDTAASQQGQTRSGVWCPVDGTPYSSLGQLQHLEGKLPDLYLHQAEAAQAAKYVKLHSALQLLSFCGHQLCLAVKMTACFSGKMAC